MISFVVSLAVLSVMFTLTSGAAFLYRKVYLKGREGLMYPIWIVFLAFSVIPLRFDLPSINPDNTAETVPQSEISGVYQGNYSELVLAERLYTTESGAGVPEYDSEPESRIMLETRRFLAYAAANSETICAVIFIFWLFGASVSFSHSMSSYFVGKNLLLASSSVCTDGRLYKMLAECGNEIGLYRKVKLRIFNGESLCSPCVCGCIVPVLYLEPGCAKLSDKELKCVIAHELNHIRRGDMILKLFSRFVAAVHWLNPSVRKVLKTVFEDCELACDYSVLRVYGREISGTYMTTILDFAERFSENSRLIGTQGISGGLFISRSGGAVFLKRRYANMKNFRKNHTAVVISIIFAVICVSVNALALSSCSDFRPGSFSSIINLSAPVEQMLRAYYGLSPDDFITPEMVDGITSLKISMNLTYNNKILADFVVNGETGFTQALPDYVMSGYWKATIIPTIEKGIENSFVEKTEKQRLEAFYALRDSNEPSLTENARHELLLAMPMLQEKVAVYVFDPYASEREIGKIYEIFDKAGLVDAWEVNSIAFDSAQFAYFSNLTEIEFVGFSPANYTFSSNVAVTLTNTLKSYADTYARDSARTITPSAEKNFITEREETDYETPSDGSEIVIPVNSSLAAAIREYFVMENYDMSKTPLTTKHLEKITSIKAEIDSELTQILHMYNDESMFPECSYIRYTINGYELDVIPHYYNKNDFEVLFLGVLRDDTVGRLLKEYYEYSEEFGCYVLSGDISENDKNAIFKGFASEALPRIAIVGQLESGVYLTQFMSNSSRAFGIAPRYLDATEAFDQSDRELFPNLTEWNILF